MLERGWLVHAIHGGAFGLVEVNALMWYANGSWKVILPVHAICIFLCGWGLSVLEFLIVGDFCGRVYSDDWVGCRVRLRLTFALS